MYLRKIRINTRVWQLWNSDVQYTLKGYFLGLLVRGAERRVPAVLRSGSLGTWGRERGVSAILLSRSLGTWGRERGCLPFYFLGLLVRGAERGGVCHSTFWVSWYVGQRVAV